MLSIITIHGFRGNIKENNLKNSTLNMLKIQPYFDAIDLNNQIGILIKGEMENMELKPRRRDIVIIASAHNPSIMAPQWLKDNSLIREEPIHFVHTPDFSLFESESFSVLVDHQRLQITAKKHDNATLNSLANVASKYVDLLPHIPYQSLGLNFTWSIEMNEGETLPKIGLNINKGDLHKIVWVTLFTLCFI